MSRFSVRGFIGATKYLLQNGVPYVLSNVFNQDFLEEPFGRHRGLGHRNRNPNVQQFMLEILSCCFNIFLCILPKFH